MDVINSFWHGLGYHWWLWILSSWYAELWLFSRWVVVGWRGSAIALVTRVIISIVCQRLSLLLPLPATHDCWTRIQTWHAARYGAYMQSHCHHSRTGYWHGRFRLSWWTYKIWCMPPKVVPDRVWRIISHYATNNQALADHDRRTTDLSTIDAIWERHGRSFDL